MAPKQFFCWHTDNGNWPPLWWTWNLQKRKWRVRLQRLQHVISRKDCGQDTFVVLVQYIQQIASSCNSGILLSALPSSLDWALAGNCQKLSETTTKVGHPTQKSSQIITPFHHLMSHAQTSTDLHSFILRERCLGPTLEQMWLQRRNRPNHLATRGL